MRDLLSALQQAIKEGLGVRDLPTASRLVGGAKTEPITRNALACTGGTYACAQSEESCRGCSPKTCRVPSRCVVGC
jgi:hypothetical protein